jgi:hypothetical protein
MSPRPIVTPDVAAMLDRGCAEFRAALDASGIPYSVPEVHQMLHEQAPGLVSGAAEQIMFLLPPDEEGADEDEAQVRFEAIMNGVLDSLLAFVRRCFEEFGPVDEDELAATLDRSTLALIGRMQALSGSMTPGGRA